jgi:hypothetical protein
MDEFQQQGIHREVAFLCYFSNDVTVEVIVPIVVVLPDVKKTVGLKPEGLMDLEIKTDGSHARWAKVFS